VDEHVDRQASGCCDPSDERIARRFDRRAGAWQDSDDLPDMVGVSAQLRQLLPETGTLAPSVLELGCGTGALAVALVRDGARQVTGIDLSPSSVAVAGRRAAAAGVSDRAAFRVGNAAHERVAAHDWVILDRSLCCFGDPEALLGTALAAMPARVALSVPESRGARGLLNHVLWRAENVWDAIRGGCRGYVHDLRRIEARLARDGFRLRRSARIGLWFCAVYDRTV
jgi:SAM-dependent methyltransferase